MTKRRLINLLERWAEREAVLIMGRCLPIPEVTHQWVMGQLGGFHVVSSGICWERSTAPRGNAELDEFGAALRSISPTHQGLIIIGHFGSRDEWDELSERLGLSRRDSARMLRIAWLELMLQAMNRELL